MNLTLCWIHLLDTIVGCAHRFLCKIRGAENAEAYSHLSLADYTSCVLTDDSPPLSITQRVARRLRPCFLFIGAGRIVGPVVEASRTSTVAAHGLALAESLKSVITTTMLPATFAQEEVWYRAYHPFYLAEQIEAGAHHQTLTPEEMIAAANRAAQRVDAMFNVDDKLSDFLNATADRLRSMLDDPKVEEGSSELLRQAVSSIWASFEVFAGDTITAVVNDDPTLAMPLLSSPRLKKLFNGQQGITMEVLAAHGFNLSDKLGDVLFSTRRLDALSNIREVFAVLSGNCENIGRSLRDERLWLLNQRRHLIVHRRGVVDADYLAQTSDRVAVGSRLQVHSEDIESYLEVVRDAAVAVLAAFPRDEEKKQGIAPEGETLSGEAQG